MHLIKERSIASKIITVISLILIVIMLLSSSIIYLLVYQRMLNTNKDNMKTVIQQVYKNFESMIELQINDTEKYANNKDIYDFLANKTDVSKDSISKLLGNSFQKETTEHAFVTNSKGIIIADSSDQYINYDYSKDQYVIQALSGSTTMSGVYTSAETGKTVVTFVSPVKDNQDKVIGTIGKSIYTDYFSKGFNNFSFMNKGYIFVVDSSGNIIYHPQKYYINKKNSIAELQALISKSNSTSSVNSGSLSYEEKDVKYIAQYISVPEIKSYVILTIDNDEFLNESKITGGMIIISTIICILLMIPLLYYFINKILRPMKVVSNNAIEISKGNLRILNQIKSKDEIGKLANSFNIMVNSISNLIGDLKHVTQDLVIISETINNDQNINLANMAAINGSSEKIKIDTLDVNEAIQESFEHFKNILDRTNHIEKMSMDMEGVVKEIHITNKTAIGTVNNLKDTNMEANKNFDASAKIFNELIANVKEIGDITNIVTNISKQTNILSINASIEAAKAGETGAGFSVVADEIKKLSNGIEMQMEKINGIVKNIDLNIYHSSKYIEQMNKLSTKEAEAVENTIDEYKRAISATERIINQIYSIIDGIHSLNEENNKVESKLDSVLNICSGFKKSVGQVDEIIQNHYTETQNMEKLTQKLQYSMDSLNNSINKFMI